MKTQQCLVLVVLFAIGCNNRSTPSPGQPVAADRSSASATQLTPVRLMLNWYPEAEHGGYYAAQIQGYFAQEGLDVTIIPGGPSAPVVQQVARGEIEFGITNADRIIVARAQGANLKALLAPLQNSPRCVLVHEASGITSFDQLENLKLMLRQEHAWAKFLIKRLPLKGVELVPNSASLAPFLNDKRAAKQGYVISEPFVAQRQGAKVRSLLVADLGFNPYTSVLMTSDDLLATNRALANKMIEAARRGWQHYLDSPEATNQRIHELNPEMEMDVLAFGVAAIKKYCVAPDQPASEFGNMTLQRWTTLVDQLQDLEMIEPGQVDPASLFVPRTAAP